MPEAEKQPVEEIKAQIDGDDETQTEETPEGFIAKEQHQQEVNKQHKKFRDAERALNKAQQTADELAKKLEDIEAKSAEVIIPDVPDPLSDTFAEDVQKRDVAIERKAELKAQQEQTAEAKKREDEARVTREEEALKARVATFDTNMVTHGLNPAETKKAADTVISYGINTMFEDSLLEDPDGPLLVSYLADNPVELEEINSMTALQLAHRLDEIRPKASLLKPKTSDAPDPPVTVQGGGVPETKDWWEKGVRYE